MRRGLLTGAVAAGLAFACASPSLAQVTRSGPVEATVTEDSVALSNGLVERRWARQGLETTALADLRAGGRVWARARRDFALTVAGAEVGSDQFAVQDVKVTEISGGGLRVEMALAPIPGAPTPLEATRVAEAYPGVAGIRTQTILRPLAPVTISGATLDEAAVGAATPTLHAFRAGADWREPGWAGPPVFTGDPHAGTWRDTRSAARGTALAGPGQWLAVAEAGRTLFMVMERVDLPSSRGSYDGDVASVRIDYPKDVLSLGPFEEQAHFENPSDAPGGRQRTLQPGRTYALEATFTGVGLSDEDAAWQHHRYLTGPRGGSYRREVVFNSNGTDSDAISTGAKDDMDYAMVQRVAPVARALGIETFVLDDGWQAISGDWEPDSPSHPEPRYDGSPDSKFKPRFPDDEFKAVRDAIAPMRLGLWMSPMSFHPNSETYKQHPDWGCKPVGDGTALANALDPEGTGPVGGSGEAGIGLWSPAAIPHVESRIRKAITDWGVTYFKFDFLVWLDCAGQGDLYDYKDAFAAMVDRLRRDHPGVTFQIDETNDYRLFPFESVARGPSWFQNGSPPPDRLLHNLWNLAPYVPTWSLGQHFLGGRQWRDYPVATLMAGALASHMTFFSDLRQLPAEVVDAAAPWTAFYRRHRELFDGVTYPLLADPLDKDWTALQSWDPDEGSGALLVFRQEGADATRMVALRNVPPRRSFRLFLAPDDTPLGTATSADLERGIEVSLPEKRAAKVIGIVPVEERSGGGGPQGGGVEGGAPGGGGQPGGGGVGGVLGREITGRSRTCLARRSPIGPRNIGRVRIGLTRAALLRRVGPRPVRRSRRYMRWCVKGGGGTVTAVFGRRGRSVLVATTAPRHGNGRTFRGTGIGRLRQSFPRARRISRSLFRERPRSPRVLGVVAGRVQYVAVVDRRSLRTPSAIGRYLVLARLR